MREETRAVLQDMNAWPWFERVGESISETGVVSVSSWNEAVESHRSYVWECLKLQVKNVITTVVFERDWHRAQGWNPFVDEVKQVLKPLFSRIQAVGSRLSLPEEVFYHQVTWDLVAIAVETEYADLYPPLFSVPVLASWYRAGHFPCGWDGPILDTDWDGKFPNYKLYVF